MSPTEIMKSLSEDELRNIYNQFGSSEITRDQMIASVMFMMNLGESKASEFVDWNLAGLAQMDFDIELRSKFSSENSDAINL